MVGVAVAAWVLSQLGPKLMRVDLAEECRKLEEEMQGGKLAALPVRREFELRAYAVDPGSPWVGRRVAALEGAASGERLTVDRVAQRRPGPRGAIAGLHLRAGDVVAVAGRRTTLVEVLERPGSGLREVDDKELLDLPGDARRRRRHQRGDRRPYAARSSARSKRRAACFSRASRARASRSACCRRRRCSAATC